MSQQQQQQQIRVPAATSQGAPLQLGDDFESFNVKFLGSQKLRMDRCVPQTVVQVIRETEFSRKQLKIKTATLFEMCVHSNAIKLVDKGTTTKKSSKQIKKMAAAPHRAGGPVRVYNIDLVRCCAYQVENPQFFGFITIQPGNAQHCACHVFQFDRSSVSIVNAIA